MKERDGLNCSTPPPGRLRRNFLQTLPIPGALLVGAAIAAVACILHQYFPKPTEKPQKINPL
jgi:hypothetical protein